MGDSWELIEVKFIVNEFKAEYAGCGSHQIELITNMSRASIEQLAITCHKLLNQDAVKQLESTDFERSYENTNSE